MRRKTRPRALGGDRGSVTTEVVLYTPLLLLLMLLGVQFAVWAIAQLAVQHAANHALQTTRALDSTTTAGQTDATTVLAQIGGAVVTSPQLTINRTPDTTTVHITGTAPAVVPFLHLHVSTTVTAPTERFRPQSLRPLQGQDAVPPKDRAA